MGHAFLFVGMGGALGAMSRYGLSVIAERLVGNEFPWGTLGANLMGCFLIGLALAFAEAKVIVGPSERLFFITGFLGALTTFSTYALESILYAKDGAWHTALLNIVGTHVFGILLVLAGLWLGARLVGRVGA